LNLSSTSLSTFDHPSASASSSSKTTEAATATTQIGNDIDLDETSNSSFEGGPIHFSAQGGISDRGTSSYVTAAEPPDLSHLQQLGNNNNNSNNISIPHTNTNNNNTKNESNTSSLNSSPVKSSPLVLSLDSISASSPPKQSIQSPISPFTTSASLPPTIPSNYVQNRKDGDIPRAQTILPVSTPDHVVFSESSIRRKPSGRDNQNESQTEELKTADMGVGNGVIRSGLVGAPPAPTTPSASASLSSRDGGGRQGTSLLRRLSRSSGLFSNSSSQLILLEKYAHSATAHSDELLDTYFTISEDPSLSAGTSLTSFMVYFL
jgi:hypothetical protein